MAKTFSFKYQKVLLMIRALGFLVISNNEVNTSKDAIIFFKLVKNLVSKSSNIHKDFTLLQIVCFTVTV